MDNVIYFYYINSIGGVESFLYYLTKKYQDQDITIYYQDGNHQRVKKLSKYARVIKYRGEKIKCKRVFFNYTPGIIDNVDADEYIQIIHADYGTYDGTPATHPKITKYIGVSQRACDSFKKITGLDAECCYNPVCIDSPQKIIHLVSATRLTREKGKDRIEKLANILSDNNVKFIWTIFTNDRDVIDNPHIVYMKPRLNIIDYIADADYLVQLSDSESYCYSVVEALCVGTPVIVTDCPVFKEIGIVNEKHGFILNFDLTNVDAKKIEEGVPAFEYTPPEDNWDKYLYHGTNNYDPEDYVFVVPSKKLQDKLGYKPIQVTKEEALELEEQGCKILKY